MGNRFFRSFFLLVLDISFYPGPYYTGDNMPRYHNGYDTYKVVSISLYNRFHCL